MFRIAAVPYSAKNGSSSVGVLQYTFLVFAVFSANLAWLWIAMAFQTVSKANRLKHGGKIWLSALSDE